MAQRFHELTHITGLELFVPMNDISTVACWLLFQKARLPLAPSTAVLLFIDLLEMIHSKKCQVSLPLLNMTNNNTSIYYPWTIE
jgi:hypothetical protein